MKVLVLVQVLAHVVGIPVGVGSAVLWVVIVEVVATAAGDLVVLVTEAAQLVEEVVLIVVEVVQLVVEALLDPDEVVGQNQPSSWQRMLVDPKVRASRTARFATAV